MIAVTDLINLLDKPALKYWANNLGLKGISLKDYEPKVQKEGNIGHKQIEEYLTHGKLFDGWEIFEGVIKPFNVIGVEVDCDNGYICGRVDLILELNNEVFIVDLKRSKNIYLSTKIQLSSYKEMIGADHIAYMNLNEMKITILNIDTKKYYNILKSLYNIKRNLIELKERI